MAGVSSSTRGCFAGGSNSTVTINVISYITIATTGNSVNFGSLITAKHDCGGLSNGHGGLT